jgi:transposase InsO family protein
MKKQRRMRRVGESTAQRQQAQHTGHVWSWDFVEDQTERGTRFRVLTLIDEHTRECLAVHAAWSIRAVDVITVVEAAMERYGVPGHLRSDNGPEFIAYAIQDWLKSKGVKTIYITPGSPWENAYIESFHDKLRDECLNRELFRQLAGGASNHRSSGEWNITACGRTARGLSDARRVCGATRRFATPVGLRPPSVTKRRNKQQQTNGRTPV